MTTLRYITAGESHGKALIGILEGIPSGLSISAEDIDRDLKRRQGGHGRGGRMKIESDHAEILSGVCCGKTIGSPISILIENKDWANWQDVMSSDNLPESPHSPLWKRGAEGDFKGGKGGFSGESLSIGKPVNYRLKIREGRHRKDKEVIFDLSNSKATYINHLENEKKEFDVPAFVFDPISSFYYLRTLRLVVGESVYVTIFDSKKVWNVEVQVLRREKVTLPIGTFDTIVIKPLMKSEGIFYRKGDIYIWLTDDIKHIPVKLQTKVAVGHITATLIQGNY